MTEHTPEQQLGQLAATALDQLEGRNIIGAVLILSTDADEDGYYQTSHHVLEGQHWITTRGVVDGWCRDQDAMLFASAVHTMVDDDEDDEE